MKRVLAMLAIRTGVPRRVRTDRQDAEAKRRADEIIAKGEAALARRRVLDEVERIEDLIRRRGQKWTT